MLKFSPGDLIEETKGDKLVAHYIIIGRHYLEGCNLSQILGYSAIVVYSPNKSMWFRFNPGGHWFIRLADVMQTGSQFNVIVPSELEWEEGE